MWDLESALKFIQKIQPSAKVVGFHVCLGGGVLNKGESNNDLDLYFLPLEDESNHPDDKRRTDPVNIMEIMNRVTGNTGTYQEDYDNLRTSYRAKMVYKYTLNSKIDIFVV